MADVNVIIEDPTPIQISIEEPAPIEITVGQSGPPGQPGASAGAEAFEYVQSVPASSWTVPHGLGRRPSSVAVYDATDDEVIVGVRVIDLNTIEITAAAPFAGRVEVL